MMTGAASISVPVAIGRVAKTPRPFAGSLRISRQSLGTGRRRSSARKKRTADAAIQALRSSVVARAIADAGRSRRAGCRGAGRRHLRRRGGMLLFGFLHAGFERLDALGKVA